MTEADKKYHKTEKYKNYQIAFRASNKAYFKQWYQNKVKDKIRRKYNFNPTEEEIAQQKEFYSQYAKDYKLMWEYDIDRNKYNELFSKQNGLCAICNRPNEELRQALGVDHNHITYQIRGLLCEQCNCGLGNFQDSIDNLTNAIFYLSRYTYSGIKYENITKEQYNDLLMQQNYKCKICSINGANLKKKLAIDHNHITDEVRGLLCMNCNLGIGNFRDNIILLQNAIDYMYLFTEECIIS